MKHTCGNVVWQFQCHWLFYSVALIRDQSIYRTIRYFSDEFDDECYISSWDDQMSPKSRSRRCNYPRWMTSFNQSHETTSNKHLVILIHSNYERFWKILIAGKAFTSRWIHTWRGITSLRQFPIPIPMEFLVRSILSRIRCNRNISCGVFRNITYFPPLFAREGTVCGVCRNIKDHWLPPFFLLMRMGSFPPSLLFSISYPSPAVKTHHRFIPYSCQLRKSAVEYTTPDCDSDSVQE